jgi:hypothetical protein
MENEISASLPVGAKHFLPEQRRNQHVIARNEMTKQTRVMIMDNKIINVSPNCFLLRAKPSQFAMTKKSNPAATQQVVMQPAFISAATQQVAMQSAFIFAATQQVAMQSAFIFAATQQVAMQPAFIFAATQQVAMQPAFIFAATQQVAMQPAFIFAATQQVAMQPAFISAATQQVAMQPAFISAATQQEVKKIYLYLLPQSKQQNKNKMKKILHSPDEVRLNNADHVEFHKQSYEICDRNAAAIDAPALLAGYHEKVAQEEYIFNWIRGSEYTKKKAEADRARNRIFTGIRSIVRANLKHFDPAIRDNATHIQNLLGNYGNITRAGYDSETADIDSLAARLRSADYLPAVQNLGLAPWITELENQNTLFKSYVDDRTQEQLEKPAVSQRAARRETAAALRAVTDRVKSLVILNGQAGYAAFIAEFNVLVNHYNALVHEHYGRLHAKTDIAPADIDEIPAQPFTGKPVYVIPTVKMVKKDRDGNETAVELLFGEEFTVSYKNNVEPGTATLFIKGIGKYAGKIVTTFNINNSN